MTTAVSIMKFSQVFKHTLKKQHMCPGESGPTQDYTVLYLLVYAV